MALLTAPGFKDESIACPADLVAAGEREVYHPEHGDPVTAAQFIALADGSAEVGYRLFALCEWQCPETLLDEDFHARAGDRCFPELFT